MFYFTIFLFKLGKTVMYIFVMIVGHPTKTVKNDVY